jgi:hypothetical protein
MNLQKYRFRSDKRIRKPVLTNSPPPTPHLARWLHTTLIYRSNAIIAFNLFVPSAFHFKKESQKPKNSIFEGLPKKNMFLALTFERTYR